MVLDAGADAVIVVPPYYFPFRDEAVERYFSYLAREINGPMYLYNFPDRTGYSISPAVVRHLVEEHENIIGIKDTIGGLDHTRDIIQAVCFVRSDFEVYSGFDENFAHNALSGGSGCIGGLSNIVPTLCADWVRAVREQNWKLAADYQQKINRLMGIYSLGVPFVPYVKEACRQMGHIACARSTFPMQLLDSGEQLRVSAFLKQEGVY